MASKAFKANNNKIVGSGDNKTNETVKNLFKNLMYVPNMKTTREPNFLTPNTKKTFNHLWLAFIKASIFQYFNLKSYISIKTDV